jgi:Domain of unknown function (DUF4397)
MASKAYIRVFPKFPPYKCKKYAGLLANGLLTIYNCVTMLYTFTRRLYLVFKEAITLKRSKTVTPFMYYFLLLSVVLIIAALAGTPATSASAESPAFVRIIHASPAVGTADVFLDGNRLLSDFGFGTVTGYAAIPPGPHKVQIALVGRGPGASAINETLSVSPGVAYTVAAIGAQQSNLSLEVFIDDNQLNPGMAKVRFYHLSPGTGSVNATTNGQQIIQGLNYQQASSYVAVHPGSYTFNVNVTQPSAQFSVPASLQANTVTSEFAVGVFNGSPKIQFVSAQVSGVPGLPSTGSDPNPTAAPVSAQPSTSGLWEMLALLVVSVVALFAWRFMHPLQWKLTGKRTVDDPQ